MVSSGSPFFSQMFLNGRFGVYLCERIFLKNVDGVIVLESDARGSSSGSPIGFRAGQVVCVGTQMCSVSEALWITYGFLKRNTIVLRKGVS